MGRSRAQLAFASLPALAPLLADADAAVRGAALAFWGRAYNLVGDDVWQYAGELAEPQKELLQDKLAWVKRQAERDAAAAARSPEAAAGRAPAVATPPGSRAPSPLGFNVESVNFSVASDDGANPVVDLNGGYFTLVVLIVWPPESAEDRCGDHRLQRHIPHAARRPPRSAAVQAPSVCSIGKTSLSTVFGRPTTVRSYPFS